MTGARTEAYDAPYAAERLERRILALCTIGIAFFLLVPIVMAVTLSFSQSPRIVFPPDGLSLRWFRAALENAAFAEGLKASVIIASLTAVISAIAGTGVAVATHHFRFRGRSLLQMLIGLPIALPAVVVGLGLLFVLPVFGLKPGLLAAALSHSVVGSAYVALLVLATFANYDLAIERAAADLGATRLQVFRTITLPMLRPGIVAGSAFAFLLSFDNVSLSLFVTRGDTLPLRLMQHIQFQADPTVAAVSTLLLAFSLVFLVLFFRAISDGQLDALRRRGR
jgi:putative spermidine/putrescine transport system permease protein